MSLTRIASRYAKSLIDFTQAQGKLDRIYEDILNLKVAADIREFNLLCKSPIITSGKKSEVYRALFEKIFDPITFGFFNILVRKGREEYMPEIAHEFLKQYDAINKKTKVVLTTAEGIDPELVETIKAKLTQAVSTRDNIELETKVNPKLIGGFMIEYDDNLYDASIAHQLHNMKKALAGAEITSESSSSDNPKKN